MSDSILRAGAATRDISPRRPTALYGYPHVERISTGVHDPLQATAIVLANGETMVVLISLEVLMIEPSFARELRGAVAEAVGCDEAGVFISCSHTHSGPVTSRLVGWQNDPTIPAPDPAYLAWMKQHTIEAAAEAAQSPAPAELAWTGADASGVGGNRLSGDGATDTKCGVLAIRHAESKDLIGVSMIYGMHPTILHEDSTLVSADFPYYARLHVQEHAGRAIPVSYHMAPAGNQSPRRFVTEQTFAEAERLGRELGAAVCDALDAVADDHWEANPDINGKLAQVSLPRNTIRSLREAETLHAECVDRFDQLKRNQAPRTEVRTAECAIFGAEGCLALAQAQKSGELDACLEAYDPVDVQVLRIGDVRIVGLPGECFVEYALDLKRRSVRRTFVVSLVNGDLQGYIVTPQAALAGGYEATNAVFAPEAGHVLTETALDTFEAMK